MLQFRWMFGLLVALASIVSPASAQDAEIKADDTVVVTADKARFMLGSTVLAEIPKDTELKVIKVHNNWVGVVYKVNNEDKGGWIHRRFVKLAAAPAPAENKPAPMPEPKKEEPKPKPKKEEP